MAAKRKPAIEGKTRGAGNWSDDTVRLIAKAYRGVMGKDKKAQAKRIVSAAKKKNKWQLFDPADTPAKKQLEKIHILDEKMSGQFARSATARRKKGYRR